MVIPKYLQEYSDFDKSDLRESNRKWFSQAKYGLFLHYGLYSLLGKHEWIMYRNKIRVKQYELLKDQFTAEKFDANYIVSFARDCGMKYINITTRHHDSFCLWDTKYTEFNSINSPAHRDLVAELTTACEQQGLALFLYYSHGRDWRHPHAPNNDKWGGNARPSYWFKEKSYKYKNEHDLNLYLEFMKNQIKELLTKFPTVAGIWLDGIMTPLSGDLSKFKCDELYELIRQTNSHALISYKQGLLGNEDYFAPEKHVPTRNSNAISKGKIYDNPNKKIEVCATMTIKPPSWGYYKNARHRTVDEVLDLWKEVQSTGANLLLNTGPLPDGSIDPVDDRVLRAVSQKLK
jgi:alpha-L-fucosidase